MTDSTKRDSDWLTTPTFPRLWRRHFRKLRADLAFQAVEIPAGTHHLRWIYRDPYPGIGAAVPTLSLAACLLFSVRRVEPL